MHKSEFPKMHRYVGFWQIGSHFCVRSLYQVCLCVCVHVHIMCEWICKRGFIRMLVRPIFELTDVYLSTQLVFDLQLSNLVAELSYHCTYVTGPMKIDHVSANYTKLYFC